MPEVYLFSDYKEYLNAVVKEGGWGAISRIADAAGCQRSYLSRVLNGDIHLTPDHASGISDYLQLDDQAFEYFMVLIELGRSATVRYRKRLEKKLKALRTERENLVARLDRPQSKLGDELIYYSAWYYSAIHVLVSIPEYQTVPAISAKLQLPSEVIRTALETLETHQLVKRNGNRFEYFGFQLHVPKNSPLVNLHHNNWRQRAVLDAQLNLDASVHFTAVQSVSLKVAEEIKVELLAFIEDAIKRAGPSSSEELVCINCDFFRV